MKVKKEISLALFIGLLLALLITGGVLRARRALQNFTPPSLSFRATPNPTPSPSSLYLEITSPDNVVTDTSKLTISGKTIPATFVAILGENGEYLIVPDELGSFSQEIGLTKGANTIKVTVYTINGERVEKTLNAVYTTAEI